MVFGLLWLVAGAAVGWVGVAGARGRLPRQHWAGIRLPSTMRSDTAWDAAHRAGGPWIAAGGAISALIGLVALVTAPDDETTASLSLAVAVLVVVAVSVGGVVGVRAARRV